MYIAKMWLEAQYKCHAEVDCLIFNPQYVHAWPCPSPCDQPKLRFTCPEVAGLFKPYCSVYCAGKEDVERAIVWAA